MNPHRPRLRTPIAAVAILLLGACATPHPATPAPAPAAVATAASAVAASSIVATAPGADDNLNAVAWVQTAVEYRLVADTIYRAASERLDAALADPQWDALPREERTHAVAALRPAVILDIDETVLDNSPYQARLVRDGLEYDEVSWDAWAREEAALAVPGALAFTQAAAARGIAVYYLSNRAEHLRAPTLRNLAKLGFPVADGAFLGLGTFVAGCEQHGSDKTCRRQLIGRDHRVLMQVGDQLGDFVAISANTPRGRAQTVAPYADWIGARWWMLPNPTYGSWLPALFDNDYARPDTERRRAIRAALRYE